MRGVDNCVDYIIGFDEKSGVCRTGHAKGQKISALLAEFECVVVFDWGDR